MDVKSAAVTGPTGAIGMALVRLMAQRGIRVLALTRPDSPRSAALEGIDNVTPVPCDLSGLRGLDTGNLRADAFFHLGWAGTTGPGRQDMRLQLDNIRFSLDAADLASRLGCRVFVGAGSQAEYGRTDEVLTPLTPAFPENGYGTGKLCAGNMTRIRCGQLGIRHVWARILSVYGPYDAEHNLIMHMLLALRRGETAPATAGEQIWTFLYSADAAEGLLALARDGADGKTYLLGGSQTGTLRSFLETVREVAGSGYLDFGAIPYPPGQVMYLKADTGDTLRDTGWTPHTGFREGMEKTLSWLEETEKKA